MFVTVVISTSAERCDVIVTMPYLNGHRYRLVAIFNISAHASPARTAALVSVRDVTALVSERA